MPLYYNPVEQKLVKCGIDPACTLKAYCPETPPPWCLVSCADRTHVFGAFGGTWDVQIVAPPGCVWHLVLSPDLSTPNVVGIGTETKTLTCGANCLPGCIPHIEHSYVWYGLPLPNPGMYPPNNQAPIELEHGIDGIVYPLRVWHTGGLSVNFEPGPLNCSVPPSIPSCPAAVLVGLIPNVPGATVVVNRPYACTPGVGPHYNSLECILTDGANRYLNSKNNVAPTGVETCTVSFTWAEGNMCGPPPCSNPNPPWCGCIPPPLE